MNRIAALLLVLAPLAAAAELGERKPVLIESKRIWDESPHCAFTDLIRFRDSWFCYSCFPFYCLNIPEVLPGFPVVP
jgi:hypothetical protein